MLDLTHIAAGDYTGNSFEDIEGEIFNINREGFENLALRIFQLQYDKR